MTRPGALRRPGAPVALTERAVPHLRRFLGQRLRALRKQRGLSQERLGRKAGLSGKFIGEVERGEKSISVDSLYHVAVALEVPLRYLVDIRPGRRAGAGAEAEALFALVATHRRPADVRKALRVVRAVLSRR